MRENGIICPLGVLSPVLKQFFVPGAILPILWGSKLLLACQKLLGNYFSGHPGNFGFYYLCHYLPKIPGELFFGPSR